MREYYVKEGAKSARPIQLRIFRKPTEFFLKASFRDARYTYPDTRQFVWHTLGGFSFDLFYRYRRGTRIVWRWSEQMLHIEVGIESDTVEGRTRTEMLFSMTPLDDLYATAYINHNEGLVEWHLAVNLGDSHAAHQVDFAEKLPGWFRELNVRFAHNAPRTIRLDKETEVRWLN